MNGKQDNDKDYTVISESVKERRSPGRKLLMAAGAVTGAVLVLAALGFAFVPEKESGSQGRHTASGAEAVDGGTWITADAAGASGSTAGKTGAGLPDGGTWGSADAAGASGAAAGKPGAGPADGGIRGSADAAGASGSAAGQPGAGPADGGIRGSADAAGASGSAAGQPGVGSADGGTGGTEAAAGAWPGEGDTNERLYEAALRAERSVVTVTGTTEAEDLFRKRHVMTASASGLVLRVENGRCDILTRGGVAEGVETLLVTFQDGSIAPGELAATDSLTGTAVVSVDMDGLTVSEDTVIPAEIGSAAGLTHGDSVVAIGSPLGYSDSIEIGAVSAVGSSVPIPDGEYSVILTNIIGSSSGSGILADAGGRAVGWIDGSYAEEDVPVTAAVPLEDLMGTVSMMMDGVTPGYAGITGVTVTAEQSRATGVPEGVYVTDVDTDSPAFAAGLMEGDVIISADDGRLTDMAALGRSIQGTEAGGRLGLRIRRRGAKGYVEKMITITMGERK